MEVFENYCVKKESTFKIGGQVKKAWFPSNVDELVYLLENEDYDMVLGGCSNILFSSGSIDKKIIFTKNINDFSICNNLVKVSAGARGALVSKECREKSLTGFEFLIGFPGTFGGMIYMNASAHNQAIADNFKSARVFDKKNKKIITFYKGDMNFKYRNTRLSCGDYIVLDAEFELKNGNYEQISELMKRNIEFRQSRQPSLALGNAGSVFKNPDNDSAGRLLDLCEMKGEIQGGAKVFDKHANFIVNYNNADSLDVVLLMYKMYSKVREKYTIILKPEIQYIGDEGTEESKLWKIITEENIQRIQK